MLFYKQINSSFFLNLNLIELKYRTLEEKTYLLARGCDLILGSIGVHVILNYDCVSVL